MDPAPPSSLFTAYWGCSHPGEALHEACAGRWIETAPTHWPGVSCPLCRRPQRSVTVRYAVFARAGRPRAVERRLRPRLTKEKLMEDYLLVTPAGDTAGGIADELLLRFGLDPAGADLAVAGVPLPRGWRVGPLVTRGLKIRISAPYA